jgi:hypothetical protein
LWWRLAAAVVEQAYQVEEGVAVELVVLGLERHFV